MKTSTNKTKRPTQRDIARLAGVSQATVSYVISGGGSTRIPEETRSRVLKIIDELGYAPNPQARSLRTGRTNVVALMVPDICNPYYAELVRGVQSVLGQHGLDMLVYNTDVPGGQSEGHGVKYLNQVRRQGVDGLIVADAALYRIQHEVSEVDTHTVFIGHMGDPVMDNVQDDNFEAAYRMGRHLVARGHRRIAHITGPSFFQFAMARRAGFEHALQEAGIEISDSLRYEGSFLAPSGHEAVSWLLEKHGADLPSAAFFANALMARGALAAFADHDIRVPDEIAVATYDIYEQLSDIRPRLTTIGVEPLEAARAAVNLLVDRVSGKLTGPPKKVLLKAAMEIHETA